MKTQKENVFLDKFRLLNSQECSEEITWSSSSLSDYENLDYNKSVCKNTNSVRRKRKLKKKSLNNLSNLDITIIDCTEDQKRAKNIEKSPILCKKTRISKSPILTQKNDDNSPILTTRSILNSPILLPKLSPKSTMKVKKKLFSIDPKQINKINEKTKITLNNNCNNINPNPNRINTDKIKLEIGCSNDIVKEEICENRSNDGTSKAKLDLTKKVSTFFDRNFCSQSTSEHSIHDTTDTSSMSEVEILTCKSQNEVPSKEIKKEISATTSTDSTFDNDRRKKVRYKKGGLAYRLTDLLKKQNAKISLWQHEKYLAENSNFVIPKEEYTAFRVKDVKLKYGVYILECLNFEDEKFIILINKCYVINNVLCESVLKLYKPYSILDYEEDCKLIVNVCRFEHFCIKNEFQGSCREIKLC